MGILLQEQNRYIRDVLAAINGLTIYDGISEDPFVRGLRDLLVSLLRADESDADYPTVSLLDNMDAYCDLWRILFEETGVAVPDLSEYLIARMKGSDNAFSRKAASAKGPIAMSGDPVFFGIVLGDLDRLKVLSSLPARMITALFSPLSSGSLPEWSHRVNADNPSVLMTNLWDFHRKQGFGPFAVCDTFLWKGNALIPVYDPDPILPEQLFCYDFEIDQVRSNTIRLLDRRRADNLLLFGARGTGKSSAVKAVANEYRHRGLRLIEIDKDDLLTIHGLLSLLAGHASSNLSFLLFLDDLSFPEDDPRCTVLKTLLEGTAKSRPENVAIYATSNRRHIVAEKDGNDRYESDAKEEKLSLSDRFGISIRFSSPTQGTYLSIVRGILSSRGMQFNPDQLDAEALAWAMRENGRSPRTARQFADYYESTFRSDTKENGD